jgi:flavodoxin
MTNKKVLVVYYSSGGITRQLGQAIAQELACPSEEIVPLGKPAGDPKQLEIQPLKNDPSQFDVVILGTPTWGMRPSPPAQVFLMRHAGRLPDLAFFCSYGLFSGAGTIKGLTVLAEKPPIADLAVHRSKVQRGQYQDKLKQFIDKIR